MKCQSLNLRCLLLGSHAHAAGGAQRRNNRRSDTCNHLQNKLNRFLLCHSLNLLIFNFQLSIFNWIGA